MPDILVTMTVKEAVEHLAKPDKRHLQRYLQRWGETFGIRLNEFHIGHILTYRRERIQEVEAAIVNQEIGALLMLLRKLNLAEEVERSYRLIAGRVVKPDDGRCLYREHFAKKDGTISKITRQCPRQAHVDEHGGVNRYCKEHLAADIEEQRRWLNPSKPRVRYVPGPRTVQ